MSENNNLTSSLLGGKKYQKNAHLNVLLNV